MLVNASKLCFLSLMFLMLTKPTNTSHTDSTKMTQHIPGAHYPGDCVVTFDIVYAICLYMYPLGVHKIMQFLSYFSPLKPNTKNCLLYMWVSLPCFGSASLLQRFVSFITINRKIGPSAYQLPQPHHSGNNLRTSQPCTTLNRYIPFSDPPRISHYYEVKNSECDVENAGVICTNKHCELK